MDGRKYVVDLYGYLVSQPRNLVALLCFDRLWDDFDIMEV
jgi:hypothetical protein